MATVEEIVRDVQAAVPTSVGGLAIAKWISNRYVEMVTKVQFRHLRKIGELSLPAVANTGSVSATRGSTSVTGSDTLFTSEIGSGAQTVWYIRISSAWYKIASIASDTALTLSSAFAEDTVSDVSYSAVRRYHSLASDARFLGSFVHTRLSRELSIISQAELDISSPDRRVVGSPPLIISEFSVDASGYRQVEAYPIPTETELIHYTYWALPTALTISSTLPLVIDDFVLKEGVLIDVYRRAKVEQIEKGNPEAAAVYANEEAKQRTIWRDAIKSAVRTQAGVNDITFIISNFGGKRQSSDITTARDQILSTWTR